MKCGRKMSRLVAIAVVLMMTGCGLAEFPLVGAQGRAGNVDAAAIGFTSHKDLDDPNPVTVPYAPANTTVVATVRNTGASAITGQLPVTMEVGKGTADTRFYEDAEGAWMPSGWSVTDFTGAKWHSTARAFFSPGRSAWAGIEDQAAVQYGANWAESMTLALNVTVPGGGSPTLQFYHYFSTKFNTDGGYVEIRNMSVTPERWDRNVSGNWSFTGIGYNGTTATINPTGTNDAPCFCGDSTGWQMASINLAYYTGYNIRVRFIFSSSNVPQNPGQLNGWFVDDVKISDSITTAFQDSFDSFANWTAANMRAAGMVAPGWRQDNGGNPNNASGSKCFSNKNQANGAYIDGEDSALATPSISLAGATNARLYFWMKISSQAFSDGGFLEVQGSNGSWVPLETPWLSTWNGGTLDTMSAYRGRNAYSSSPNVWTKVVFDLSKYTGSSVRVRFHFYSFDDGNTGFGWYLDEIKVVAWNFAVSGSSQKNAPTPLNPAQTANIQFTFDLSGGEGTYSFKLISNLPGDEDGSNDAYTIIIEVRKEMGLDMSFSQNPVSILHGRTENVTVRVTNKGNMPDDVTLRLVSYPPDWSLILNRTNITAIRDNATANVNLRITVPIDESSTIFFITVNVTSRQNSSITRERTLQVSVTNGPPTATQNNPSPNPAAVFQTVKFDGSPSSDPDGDALNYSWEFGDGTAVVYGPVVYHAFGVKGSYNIRLNVSDGGPGSSDEDIKVLTVTDAAPTPIITVITTPYNGSFQINSPVKFNGSSSNDEQTSSLNYTWDFGDETVDYGMEVSHNFTSRGKFNVTLTVTDKGGQSMTSAPVRISINAYPVAIISSPTDGSTVSTGDSIRFESNGSSDPDGDPLTYEWLDNQAGEAPISTSSSFSTIFEIGGLSHKITLNVYDGHGKLSYNFTQITIIVINRTNHPPRLENGTVSPKEGDQGYQFNYTVRYFDEDNDPPQYLNVLIDNKPQTMLLTPSNWQDNNYRDGKDYFFVPLGTLLKGQDYPHNYSFETADKKSGKVTTDIYDGPTVKWVRPIGKDSWMPEIVPGSVYLIGDYRTLLSGVNITPPAIPTGNESLGLAFLMNTTAPANLWFWANITIKYNNVNYSSFCESTLRVWWSLEGAPWALVPNSGLDLDKHLLWFNVTRPNAKYAVFGTPLPPQPPPKHNGTGPDYTWMIVGAVVAVVAVAGIGFFLMMRKRKAASAEPGRESRVEPATGETVSGEAMTPAREAKAARAEAEEPEPVKTFQPGAGASVAIFRPGEGSRTKVFRPGGEEEPTMATPSTEEEEKIFRPESRDVEDGETAEGPVVQEEAVKAKVVEYTDEKTLDTEETPEMPGARPAEEEIEEVEGKKPIPKPAPKKADESLDDLMKELDK